MNRHATRSLRATALTAPLFGLALMLGACSDDEGPLAPGQAGPADVRFTESATPEEIRDAAADGPVRIEVELLPGGPPWMARELELEGDERGDEEKLESRIVAADPASGTVDVAFGNLTIDLSQAGRFRTEESGDVSRDVFFQRVTQALEAGRAPGVELRRPPRSEPQDPSDPAFLPTDVRLDDGADEDELEIDVDERHLEVTGDRTGVLTVLGVEIEIGGSTEVGRRTEEAEGATEIEGLVEAVDPAAETVTLRDGRIIRLVEGTEFDADEDELRTLGEVAEAVSDGLLVEVEAEVVREEGDTFVAIEIEFEVEDDADDAAGAMEFEGLVTAVNTGQGTFVLDGTTELSIVSDTRIDDEGDLRSLAEVETALDQGRVVRAEGHAATEGSAPSGVAVLDVKFETDDD